MSPARLAALLWIAQRASAAVLAVCVIVHLTVIVIAVRGGLSAAEILGRTRGSITWLAFYGVFVLAIAMHVPIGLRTVIREWTPWRGVRVDHAMAAFGMVLLVLGWRAIAGVVL